MKLTERRQQVETGVAKLKKANKGGRRESDREKLVKKREKNQREKVLKTRNLLSPK